MYYDIYIYYQVYFTYDIRQQLTVSKQSQAIMYLDLKEKRIKKNDLHVHVLTIPSFLYETKSCSFKSHKLVTVTNADHEEVVRARSIDINIDADTD
jgi:hypothetical protein